MAKIEPKRSTAEKNRYSVGNQSLSCRAVKSIKASSTIRDPARLLVQIGWGKWCITVTKVWMGLAAEMMGWGRQARKIAQTDWPARNSDAFMQSDIHAFSKKGTLSRLNWSIISGGTSKISCPLRAEERSDKSAVFTFLRVLAIITKGPIPTMYAAMKSAQVGQWPLPSM